MRLCAAIFPSCRAQGLAKRMERVYDGMGDRLAMRHHLDRYDELSEGPPAHGLDDEVLRRMASYLLSLAEGRWRRLAKSIPALWKRGERTQETGRDAACEPS